MYINVMRYRTGKFGVSVVEMSKNGKTVNKSYEIQAMKREFGASCVEYRVDSKDGVTHWWTFNGISAVSDALNKLPFPSIDNDEPED